MLCTLILSQITPIEPSTAGNQSCKTVRRKGFQASALYVQLFCVIAFMIIIIMVVVTVILTLGQTVGGRA